MSVVRWLVVRCPIPISLPDVSCKPPCLVPAHFLDRDLAGRRPGLYLVPAAVYNAAFRFAAAWDEFRHGVWNSGDTVTEGFDCRKIREDALGSERGLVDDG